MTSQPTFTPIDVARDRVRAVYASAMGRRRAELVTPALVLDIAAARRNIAAMAEQLSVLPAEIRPHIKVHKSPDLARMQIKAGAIGISTATVWEAIVMIDAGLDDIFVVNTVAGAAKIRALAEQARDHRILLAVDEIENARALSAAAEAAGSILGVLIEVDTGMDRAGVDTVEDALALARDVTRLPSLRFDGLTGYEGHCSLIPDRDERRRKQQEAMEFFVSVAERLEADGIRVAIRSAGGTATWRWTAAFPGITEIQAGSYVVMDNFHGQMAPEFEKALTVAATVVSRRSNRVIIDAGAKSVAAAELCTIHGHDLDVLRFDEEHGIFIATPSTQLRVGDVVELIPGYAPSTVNWFDAYHVIEDGVVVDIWPIIPRGPGHSGLIGG